MPELEISGPVGVLRARHDPPQAPAPESGPLAALVCHPHPLHGGTMDNKVVMALTKALRAAGLHVLRFNFRGAGGSEGEHDAARGEQDDVRAALDTLLELAGLSAAEASAEGGALLVAGFSFGSYVGLEVGRADPRVGALLAVAPPVNHYDYSAIATCGKPLCVVYARDDELVPVTEVERWLTSVSPPPRLVPVVGATHLFHGKLRPLATAVDGFLGALRERRPAR